MSGYTRSNFRRSTMLRLAGPGLVLGAAVFVAGCSNNVSRFDYPAFANNSSDSGLTTGSLHPVPAEAVYPNGAPANANSVVRQDLPPPAQAPAPYPQQQQYAYAPPAQAAPPPQPSYRPVPAYQPPAPQAQTRPPAPKKPANKTVTVRSGDTLSKFSREYGVSVDDIKTANDLTSTRLSVGQELVIPGAGGATSASDTSTSVTYVVERGDSISKIAREQNVSQDKLIAANKLKRPYRLSLGQKLIIPGKAAVTPKPVRVASRGPNIPLPSAKPEPAATTSKTKVAARTSNLPKPEPMAGNQFRWPVKGRIISGFGPKPSGKHNDGINVAVPKGTSIKAAENGVVAYAGSELQPYGNLILVRHANNWVTAYAHNDELLVKRGDTVRRGQIIAKAGQSGNVTQPQLHFELRKGSKPVNPLSYMANSS